MKILIFVLVLVGVAVPLGRASNQFPGESLSRCARENFSSADITNDNIPGSQKWIHQQYCTQVAVEFAKDYVKEHPSFLDGKEEK